MSRAWRGTLTGLIFGLAGAPNATAEQGTHEVRVCVSDQVHLPPQTWAAAQADVTRIFSQAGITLTWAAGHETTSDCHLLVVLADEPAKGSGLAADTLGAARPQPRSAAPIAFAFVRRIAAAARDLEQPVPAVLSSVAAHELGHLLLTSVRRTPRAG